MRNEEKTVITLTADCMLVFVAALLLIPLKWLFAWYFAALIHELCHYAALQICNCRIIGVRIGVFGAVIATEALSNWKECLCSLAGPVGGFLLLLFAKQMPVLAVCAFLQSAYNLLPVYPLDGGRVLFCVMRGIFKAQSAERMIKIWKIVVLVIVTFFGAYATFKLLLGPIPIIVSVMITLRNKNFLALQPGNEYNMDSIY